MNKLTISKPRRWLLALLIAGGLLVSALAYPLVQDHSGEAAWHSDAIACSPQTTGGGGGGC
jgi:hypothetical protein